MQIYDIHSHWSTERGYALRTPDERAQQKKVWNSEPHIISEAEMAEEFRRAQVRVILDLGYTKRLPLDEVKELHDYALATQRAYPDVILGNWLHIHPKTGADGVRELRRCIDASNGRVGFVVSGMGVRPASDPIWEPFFQLCREAKVPVLILVGFAGLGAGLPGGGGMILDDCHPRHLDFVAARYPDLILVAGRPGWPWQAETNAVLLHKRNVWYELHGWSPKYHTPELKHEIPRRFQDRVMFGADYPLFTYERLVRDWQAEGYGDKVLEKLFTLNPKRFLSELGW
jgi:predicted TIM-barrel fold metal-dependent hydrolase